MNVDQAALVCVTGNGLERAVGKEVQRAEG